jgi:regulator of sigma E protease
MNLINTVVSDIEWMGWYVVPFVAIISAIVFFHELGHYSVGRLCGVKVEAFSLGFGPEIFAWVDRHGTRWRLAAFPLGGYVKFMGDADAASSTDQRAVDAMAPSDRARSLAGQPLRNRAAIVAAGPLANFILAIVIFTCLFMVFGRSEHSARIGVVESGSAAAEAGFMPGDLVKTIDGHEISSFLDIQQAALLNTGLTITFGVERDGREVTLDAAPRITLVDQGVLGKRRIGHLGLGPSRNPGDTRFERCSAPTCAVWATEQVAFISHATFAYVSGLFAGRESVDQVSGPIAISQIAGEMAKISLWELVNLAGLFSVSVGLMNLLPIPMLDGGHLLFFAFEAIRGKPLSERIQMVGIRIGIALVAALMIFTTSHDLLRLFGGQN